jgi:excisionase family DNA binding protein
MSSHSDASIWADISARAQQRAQAGKSDDALVPLDFATATGADTPEVQVLIAARGNPGPNGFQSRAAISTVRRYTQWRPACGLASHGEIPPFRLGSDWRVRRVDVEEWLAKQKAGPRLGASAGAETAMKKPGGVRKRAGRPRGRRPPPGDADESALMTLHAVADYLDCHDTTSRKLVHRRKFQGKIPGFRLGGEWRVLKSELDKWMAKGGRQRLTPVSASSGAGRGGPDGMVDTRREAVAGVVLTSAERLSQNDTDPLLGKTVSLLQMTLNP